MNIIQEEKDKIQSIMEAETPNFPPIKEEITFDDFSKLDIRTGKIVTAEKVDGADKLLKLTVDIGLEKRTIVSGIAMHFNPTDLPGQKVSVLCNLAPRKLRGVMSNGMILMSEDQGGKLHFVQDGADVEPGCGVS